MAVSGSHLLVHETVFVLGSSVARVLCHCVFVYSTVYVVFVWPPVLECIMFQAVCGCGLWRRSQAMVHVLLCSRCSWASGSM